MTRAEAIMKLKNTVGLYLMGGHADSTYCGEWREIIETLEQEPICPSHGIDCEDCPAYDPCGNAISRQAVLDLAKKGVLVSNGNYKSVCKAINELPSVNPTKTGRWIQTNEFFINQNGQFIYRFICSECKSLSYFRKSNKKAIGANVCPNCGAKMQEVEE